MRTRPEAVAVVVALLLLVVAAAIATAVLTDSIPLTFAASLASTGMVVLALVYLP